MQNLDNDSIDSDLIEMKNNFMEKNVERKSKKDVVLLIFDDNTMKPVVNIDDKYITIIKQWYSDCNLFIDIEPTNVSVPYELEKKDVSDILCQKINYKCKDTYVKTILPLMFEEAISKKTIEAFKKQWFFDYRSKVDLYENESNKNILKKLIVDKKIIVPENMGVSSVVKNHNYAPFDDNNVTLQSMSPIIPDNDSREIFPSNQLFYNKNNNESDNPIVCYNTEYNVLNTSFGSNCENISTTEEKCDVIYVLLNERVLKTITVLNPTDCMLLIINNHYEYGFIKLFAISTKNKDVIKFIESEFNNAVFNSVENVNNMISITDNYIRLNKKSSTDSFVKEQESVVKYLNENYDFDDDDTHKINAHYFHKEISKTYLIFIDGDNINSFETRLVTYIANFGLKKKKYADGIYYYGVAKKPLFNC